MTSQTSSSSPPPAAETLSSRRAGLVSLVRVALAALRFRPPLYLHSLFGPASTWLARPHRLSEFTLVSWRRPGRSLSFLSRVLVPASRRSPPRLVALLPAAVRRFFWRPTTAFDHPPRAAERGDSLDRPGERWFFINGIVATRTMVDLNAELLVRMFGRRLTVIHNSTASILFDVYEAALGKAFKTHPDLTAPESLTEPCLVAATRILEAINDEEVERVVVLAHSQGTIIAANALRAMARALEAADRATAHASEGGGVERATAQFTRRLAARQRPVGRRFADAMVDLAAAGDGARRRLGKLELYTFANCADTMKYVSRLDGRPIPRLEHFANERDLVARLGVLSPFQPTPDLIDIDGPVYVRPATRRPREGGWGHFLNQHHLLALAEHLERRRGGGEPHPLFVGRPEDPAEPGLYGYAAGASPRRRPGEPVAG